MIQKLLLNAHKRSIHGRNQPINNTRSVTATLNDLKRDSLEQRRSEYMLTMPYRTYHKLVDIPYSDFLILSILSHMTFVLTSKNTLPKVFIFPNTIGQWSPLP